MCNLFGLQFSFDHRNEWVNRVQKCSMYGKSLSSKQLITYYIKELTVVATIFWTLEWCCFLHEDSPVVLPLSWVGFKIRSCL